MRTSIIFAAYLIADAVLLTSDRPFIEPYSHGEMAVFLTVVGVGLLFDGLELWLKWRKGTAAQPEAAATTGGKNDG